MSIDREQGRHAKWSIVGAQGLDCALPGLGFRVHGAIGVPCLGRGEPWKAWGWP